MMKIAIIGSGISGLVSAHLLSRKHDVTVFEAGDYVGGHTATVDVEVASGRYAIDTGFIVFNDWTYPHFIRLMNQLGVKYQDSTMSFSVKMETSGLEYNGTSLNTLFAQRTNLFRPSFHRMIRDILRFNREAPLLLDSGSTLTLGQYLQQQGYSNEFKHQYIVPMGAAIWSASVAQMEEFPIEFFVRFFKNHGMLSVDDRPVWKVIQGGSRSYIAPLTERFCSGIRLRTPVMRVQRAADGVTVTSRVELNGVAREQVEKFDHVVFATHAPQTLAMLADATQAERAILSAFEYQPNSTVLHTDISVLPKRPLAWAAWNYFVPRTDQGKVAVTYDMNILQGLSAPEIFCVSLNLDGQIDPSKVLRRFVYDHPVYTARAFASQQRWNEISGLARTHFCGAYWGYGFHEDGVKSGLRVADCFGEKLEAV